MARDFHPGTIMPGHKPHGRVRLLIVNADERVGRLIETVAGQTDRFSSIERMTDARFALEHVWHCIEQADGSIPDVVVTDLKLGGLGGVQLTRELRRYEETGCMLIAFLTGAAGPLERDAAENAGADIFLTLPESPADLAALLGKIANRCIAQASYPSRMLN
jgi:CheY-like chemotaxis protein